MDEKLKQIAKEVYLHWDNNVNDEVFMDSVKIDLANNYDLSNDEINQIIEYIDGFLSDLFNKTSVLNDLISIIRLDEDIAELSNRMIPCGDKVSTLHDMVVELNQKYKLGINFESDDVYENAMVGYYAIKEYLTDLLVN